MLARSSTMPTRAGYAFEPKLDGFRALLSKQAGYRLISRRVISQSSPTSSRSTTLRHAFASIAANRGIPVNVVSEVMGHSNIGVTQSVYIHLFGRDQAEDAFRAAMSQ